ncbi:MAG TPA: PAS domain-containing protein [Terriglobales bacterium]|nr:PAS domain-containing protein [Terriglobales bacterium]
MNSKEKVNILMVDDQAAKLLTYEAILSELDENLIRSNSAKEAMEVLLRNDVAVVLMDVSMPDLDGFELADMIRQHPRFKQTAIIFISGVHLTDLDRIKGYQRGAVDYVTVPVIPEVLRAKISIFAELHRKTHQLERLNRELEQRVNERTEELDRKAEALQQLNGELVQKNQELDAILQTAPDIIFSRREDGARDYISDRFYEYTGAAAGSATGAGWLDYVHPDDRGRSLAEWKRCIRSGDNYESEYRLRGSNGTYRWFHARAVPLRDRAGRPVRWYGTCSDIHDRKLLEQSIRDNALELEKVVDDRTLALRQLSSRLMRVQDDERRRVARELHDGLGQNLVAAKMHLDALLHLDFGQGQEVRETTEIIDQAIQQVRSVSHLLHPPLLDEVGLLSALQWYLDGLTKRSNIETSLAVSPDDLPRLRPEMETAVFRIVQEALTNVYRHSGASHARVTLCWQNGHVSVTVEDDGKGVEERTVKLQPGGIGVGIGGMRQRAKEFGGELRMVNTNPGTRVEVVIPCDDSVSMRAKVTA